MVGSGARDRRGVRGARARRVSVEAGPADRAVPARRRGRLLRARGPDPARGDARPADPDREPRRRRRHDRRRVRREVPARRLHAARRQHRGARDERRPLLEDAVRPGEGPHADHAHRRRRLRDGGASVAARAVGGGVRRLREGASGEGELRLGGERQRAASLDGALQGARRHRPRAHSVQGRRPDGDRPSRRSDPDRHRRPGEPDAAREGRQAPRARRRHPRPFGGLPGPADDRGVGLPGIRGARLAGHRRAGRPAAGRRPAASVRDREGDGDCPTCARGSSKAGSIRSSARRRNSASSSAPRSRSGRRSRRTSARGWTEPGALSAAPADRRRTRS